jgi:probable F420-dependent oxidoreductase
MKFGAGIFPTAYSIRPDVLARALEERGFESFFVTEHTHIPASRETPFLLGPELPQEYIHVMDPFVSLSVAAMVTTRLRLGTAICLVVEHEPLALAKQVATLDVLSGGRVIFGVGGGWNLEEMRNHGTDPDHRFRLLRERVLAMKALWTQDEASFQGRYVNFERVWSYPKPLQRPHPPVYIGSNTASAATLQRVADYGDGWMPLAGFGLDADLDGHFAEHIRTVNEMAAARGRGPIPITAPALPDAAMLNRLQVAGVERALFVLPSAPEAEVLALLDELAPLVAEFGDAVVA